MGWYPGAVKKPISINYTKRVTTKTCVILHTSASLSSSLHGWFSNQSAKASSHFYIRMDGVVEQYLDTKHISWANASANSRSVTIETEGLGNEKWTPAQLESIKKVLKWSCAEHNIPVRQMNSSAASEKGIGWHRLGIDGNFPSSGILRGRNQRGTGEVWSSSRGKVCPGSLRIEQIPALIASMGATTPPPVVKPPTPESSKSWPYVAATEATRNAAWRELMGRVGFKDSGTATRMQKWLKGAGFYKGYIDNSFGKLSVKALQTFLKRKGLYKGYIDGKRQGMTKTAELAYLEAQRQIILKKEGK